MTLEFSVRRHSQDFIFWRLTFNLRWIKLWWLSDLGNWKIVWCGFFNQQLHWNHVEGWMVLAEAHHNGNSDIDYDNKDKTMKEK